MCTIKNIGSTSVNISYEMRQAFYRKYFPIFEANICFGEIEKILLDDLNQEMIDAFVVDQNLCDSSELLRRVHYNEQIHLLEEIEHYYLLKCSTSQTTISKYVMCSSSLISNDKVKVLK